MDRSEILRAITELLQKAVIGKDRVNVKPYFEKKKFRGREQFVVGYSWSNSGNPIRSVVYDVVWGAGETPDQALEKARAKIIRPDNRIGASRAKKKPRALRIVGEPIVNGTVESVADKIVDLATELRRATDALHRRQLTNSIMHLAADIAVTVSD